MATKQPISVDELRRILDFNPDTGVFIWKHRPEHNIQRNARFTGKAAGTTPTSCGYGQINLNNLGVCRAHRLAWLHYYGEWPPQQLDHINGNRLDNRIINLRLATNAQNGRNRPASIKNKTKLKGVSLHKLSGLYRASITKDYKYHYLGYFSTPEEAHSAYCRAAEHLHEEFARVA